MPSAATVDTMTVFTRLPRLRTHVVERVFLHKASPGCAPAMRRVLAFLLLTVLMTGALGPTRVFADEPQTGAGTMTDTITDPQNLLGSDVGSVKDAIEETAEQTGVSVRLLYLPHFYEGVKPEIWASRALESMKPAQDTVMLPWPLRTANWSWRSPATRRPGSRTNPAWISSRRLLWSRSPKAAILTGWARLKP